MARRMKTPDDLDALAQRFAVPAEALAAAQAERDTAPEPTPDEGKPAPTPNVEGKPPRQRGAVTERLIRERDARHALARRRWPTIGRNEAQRVCLVRRDYAEHPHTPRGRIRQEAGDDK